MNQKILTYILSFATLLLLSFTCSKLVQHSDTFKTRQEKINIAPVVPYERPKLIVKETPPPLSSDLQVISSQKEEIKKLEELPFHSRQRSRENIQKFSERTYLNTPNLESFMMEDFSQDEIAVLSGKNDSGEVLTVLASKIQINPSNLNSLIKSSPELFPVHNQNILEGSFQKVFEQKKPLNGMKNITVFTKEINGSFYIVSSGPREDDKGTYGLILESTKEDVEANYDYLENFFLGFKAREN